MMVLGRSADEKRKPPRIIGKSDESLTEILKAIDGKSRDLPSERETMKRTTG